MIGYIYIYIPLLNRGMTSTKTIVLALRVSKFALRRVFKFICLFIYCLHQQRGMYIRLDGSIFIATILINDPIVINASNIVRQTLCSIHHIRYYFYKHNLNYSSLSIVVIMCDGIPIKF